MKPKIYIDGKEGTTGLQIYERLGQRKDIELLLIDPEKRKDTAERKALINQADIVFLCLPDAAAIEAVQLVENPHTRMIDASTAHRVNPDWVYGLPELGNGQREKIKNARLVANPGCHATGFLSVTAPLVQLGVLPEYYPVTAYSLTGYSGGGKKMIVQYEAETVAQELKAPRIYGVNLNHKHLPEMQKMAGLSFPPLFSPIVDDYYKGMATVLMLNNRMLEGSPTSEDICYLLQRFYQEEAMITVKPFGTHSALLSANTMAGKDTLEITVTGSESQTIVTALFDNLGKGASGAAVQNMNLMLGFSETEGLSL